MLLHAKINITVVALSSILLLYTLFDRTHAQKSGNVPGKCPTRAGKCPNFGTRKLWCRTRIRASVVSDTWNTGHGPYLEVSCYLYVTSFIVNHFQLGMMDKGIFKNRLDEILDLYSHIFL